MNDLKIFEHPKFGKIRTIIEDGKTLFCGKDAAMALGYAKPQNAVANHCKGALKRGIPTNGGVQEMLFITEGDLCRLAAKSELPGADDFERWIFDEVIPAILRTGSYSVSGQTAPKKLFRLPEGVTLGSLVNFMKMAEQNIIDRGGTPEDIRVMMKETCEAVNFPVPTALSKQIPGQTSLFNYPALEG